MKLPAGAKVFPLTEGTKVPLKGSRGHLDAVLAPDPYEVTGNYGISLDGQYVVVDFDQPGEHEWYAQLPPTWVQKTRRGVHYLYRLGPEQDTAGIRNAKFDKGDVKVRGYIVGPGSTVAGVQYTPVGDSETADCPPWLWEYLKTARSEASEARLAGEWDKIPQGQRDDVLAQVGGLYRRIGLSEDMILRTLGVFNDVALDPPVSARDLIRISHSVAKYDPVETLGLLAPEGWETADLMEFAGPPTRFHVYGFVPRGELVMLWGRGGQGKSTFGSWLAAQVSMRGGRVAAICVEEPIKRFAWRSILNGGKPSLISGVPTPHAISFPRDANTLRRALVDQKVELLWIDSIFSHFDAVDGLNAAERARRSLAPLAAIAQETGTTIVAVFHENKAGSYLGSVEMINVARYALKAERADQGPLYISVEKTNLIDPGVRMCFRGIEVAAADPITGQVQMEELPDGTLQPMHFVVLERKDDAPKYSIDVDEIADTAPRPPLEGGAAYNPAKNLSKGT